MRIGDLEHAPRDIESSSWRRFNRAAAEIDDGIAPADPDSQVRITDWRQARDRVNSRSGGFDIDGQAIIRHWGPAVLEIFERRVAGNHEALDGSAPNMIINPGAYLAGGKYGPKPLQS
jgi:hypothetical protein